MTTDLLNEHLTQQKNSVLILEPTTLINNTENVDYLNINLHKTELRNKHIKSIKLKFISKNLDVLSQEIIDNIFNNVKYNLMVGPNVIFNNYFNQDADIITSNIILPIKYIEEHHSVCIKIIDIHNILCMLNNLELLLSFTEIEFEEKFEELLPISQIDQLIKTETNMYNLFRVLYGMGTKAIGDGDVSREQFIEISPKIGNIISV